MHTWMTWTARRIWTTVWRIMVEFGGMLVALAVGLVTVVVLVAVIGISGKPPAS